MGKLIATWILDHRERQMLVVLELDYVPACDGFLIIDFIRDKLFRHFHGHFG